MVQPKLTYKYCGKTDLKETAKYHAKLYVAQFKRKGVDYLHETVEQIDARLEALYRTS